MASISEPFTIAELSKITLRKSNHIPLDIQAEDGVIHVALSYGSVSSYRLRPTPSILSLHSVSPGTVFTALCSTKINKDRFLLAYAYHERKKSFIKIVSPILDPNARSKESSQVINTTEVEGGEVCGLKFSSDRSYLYAVFKNSSVVCYRLSVAQILPQTENAEVESGSNMEVDESENENISPDPVLSWNVRGKSSRVPILSTFTKIDNLDVLVVVEKRAIGKRHGFDVRVVALESDDSKELINLELDVQDEQEEDNSIFAYGPDGYLYRLARNVLYCHNLVSGSLVNSFDISSVLGVSENQSIEAVGNRRIVVSSSSDVHLIDTSYGSALASQHIQGDLSFVGFTGQSSSLILGILTSKASDPSLVGLSISVGRGTLFESLGHGLDKHKHSEWELGFTNGLNMKNLSLKDYTASLSKKIASAQFRANKVLEDLANYKKSNDVTNFERLVLYLQGTNWEEIKPEDISVLLSSDEDIPVFDANRDREVDKDFIARAVNLLLEKSVTDAALSDEDTFEVSLDQHFVPEFAFIYLLTHPLFPTAQMSNFLEALAPFPRLLRQAVVTTPDISCEALIKCLAFPDDEIFCDIVTRISQEFGTEQITKAIDKVYFTDSSATQQDTKSDLLETVHRLMRLDVGWSIIPALVDAGGLFLWSSEAIHELVDGVNEQVDALEVTAQTMTIIEEAIRRFDLSTDTGKLNKLSKREIKKISKKNATDEALLRFPQQKSFTEEHMPLYSVEELDIS